MFNCGCKPDELPFSSATPRGTCDIRATLGVKARPVTYRLLDHGLSKTPFGLATLWSGSQGPVPRNLTHVLSIRVSEDLCYSHQPLLAIGSPTDVRPYCQLADSRRWPRGQCRE